MDKLTFTNQEINIMTNLLYNLQYSEYIKGEIVPCRVELEKDVYLDIVFEFDLSGVHFIDNARRICLKCIIDNHNDNFVDKSHPFSRMEFIGFQDKRHCAKMIFKFIKFINEKCIPCINIVKVEDFKEGE